MVTKIGINGFGRIGRLSFKAINQLHPDKLEVVAINDLTDSKTNAHLLKWDSTYGRYPGEVIAEGDSIVVNGKNIKVVAERDPAKIPWKSLGVDIVIESTGLFTDATKAVAHIAGGGAKKVLISAPAKNEDFTVVLGVNEDKYDPKKHNIISNASCTSNCVAPLISVLNQNFGIAKGLMTTIHSYTNDQKILDQFHKDLRRARTAGQNIIPTTTGAARMVGELIPELKGKIHGLAVRVPTVTVSVVDFVAELNREVTAEQVNTAFKTAAETNLKNIMEYCTEELVSMDFKGDPASCIIDSLSTMVIGGNMVKVFAWYDNEWGYSCRLADLAAFVGEKGI
ncbi:MAG: type I glyceraldehyde-3-phosphate dehydrogenase [Dehalococcoidales bacterium]|nr:type I glyceraldehyde-3-phosphate dehydrogenase [Dehalococcoidales bacterium]